MSRATYADAILHLTDYLGGNPSDVVGRDCRRAVQEAYRDLANAQRWTYLLRQGRVVTTPPYLGDDPSVPATFGYSQATGIATLAGGSWPSWTLSGAIGVAPGPYGVPTPPTNPVDPTVPPDPLGASGGPPILLYRPQAVLDATHLRLDPAVNPGRDVPAGTPLVLYRDTYLMPEDFIAADQAIPGPTCWSMQYTHPRDWLADENWAIGMGQPGRYTFTGDERFPGRIVLRVWPLPTFALPIDFLYHRRPRALNLALAGPGSAIVAAGSTSIACPAAGSLVPPPIGAVIRISGIARSAPTAPIGDNPPAHEATILGLDPTASPSAPAFLADTPAPAALLGMPYTISDPIDIEDGAMLNAFWRCCEMHLACGRSLKDKPDAEPLYRAALALAKGADGRTFAGRHVGDAAGWAGVRAGGPYRY